MYLERKDAGFNYQAILDRLKTLSSGGGSAPAPTSGGTEKKLIINDLKITKVTVHADVMGGMPGRCF